MEVSWPIVTGVGGVITLLVALFFRSPNDQFKALESRVQTLEKSYLESAVSNGKLGSSIEHLSKVVGKLDSRLDDMTKMILDVLKDQHGTRGR